MSDDQTTNVVSARVPPGLAKWLEDAHWSLRKTKSAIVAEAIEYYLREFFPRLDGDGIPVDECYSGLDETLRRRSNPDWYGDR